MPRRHGQLESLLSDLQYHFLPRGEEDPLRAEFETLADKVRQHNRFNVVAHIPTTHFDHETVDFSEYTYGEDYEISYTMRNSHDPDLECDPSEHDEITEAAHEHADELEEEVTRLEVELEQLEEDLADAADEEDPVRHAEVTNDIAAAKKALAEAKTKAEEAENIANGWEHAESEPDEVMWNILHRFADHDPDEAIARRIGFGLVTFIAGEHEGKTFLGFCACGMDLSPKLSAFQALAYGRIDRRFIEHFEIRGSGAGFNYAKYVVGTSVAKDALAKLDVLDLAVRDGNYFDADELRRHFTDTELKQLREEAEQTP